MLYSVTLCPACSAWSSYTVWEPCCFSGRETSDLVDNNFFFIIKIVFKYLLNLVKDNKLYDPVLWFLIVQVTQFYIEYFWLKKKKTLLSSDICFSINCILGKFLFGICIVSAYGIGRSFPYE